MNPDQMPERGRFCPHGLPADGACKLCGVEDEIRALRTRLKESEATSEERADMVVKLVDREMTLRKQLDLVHEHLRAVLPIANAAVLTGTLSMRAESEYRTARQYMARLEAERRKDPDHD